MSDRAIHRAKIAGGALTVDDNPAALFPWWSVTKTVLAACALRLVGEGRLALDEGLPGRPYTLRQLLQHRAGVPNYGGLAAYHQAVERGEAPWAEDNLLARVGADRLDFPPGDGWAYSNVGYLFVRRIIERAVDANIATAIQDLVLDPLAMRSVSLARTPGDLAATAWGNPDRYHPGWVYHGLLIGTAADAALFMDAVATGRLLSPPLADAMLNRLTLGGAIPDRPWRTTGYGLGLMIGDMAPGGLAIGHSGNGPGSVCAVYHFRDCDPPCTVSTFAQTEDEGVTEHAAARLAAETC